MKNGFFRRGLVFAVIILLIGVSASACNCDKTERTFVESETDINSIEELCGLVEPEDWNIGALFDPCLPRGDLPDAFDWRDEVGGLPPVKSQVICGSCWAFGTV